MGTKTAEERETALNTLLTFTMQVRALQRLCEDAERFNEQPEMSVRAAKEVDKCINSFRIILKEGKIIEEQLKAGSMKTNEARTIVEMRAIPTLVTYKDLRSGAFFHMVQQRSLEWSGTDFHRRLRGMPGFDFPVKIEEIWDGETSIEAARIEAKKLFPDARFVGDY